MGRSTTTAGAQLPLLETDKKHKSPRNCYICGILLFVSTIVGILLSTVGHDIVYDALVDGLTKQYVLSSPTAGDFPAWQSSGDPDSPEIFNAIYVFNITNPAEVAAGGKPQIQEIGPLTYSYNYRRFNIEWDADQDGDIVAFQMWDYYQPADEITRYLSTQTIYTLNVPLLGTLHNPLLIGEGAAIDTVVLALFLEKYAKDPTSLFVSKTIYETIWGWEDPLLTELNAFNKLVPTRYPGIVNNDSSLDVAAAKHGTIRMFTGAATINEAREYLEWDGMDSMQCCAFGPCGDAGSGPYPAAPYPDGAANAIRGGFGDQFHQFVTRSDILRVSSHQQGVFRTWELVSAPDTDYSVKGIELMRFQLPPNTLGNSSTNPEEAYMYNNYGPSGLLNASVCEWGAKVFISKPHFLDGSNSLLDAIDGLTPPDRSIHDTALGVEPYSGSTMQFDFSVQVNVEIGPDSFSNQAFFPNVTNLYMPVAWLHRYGLVSDSQADNFKGQVYLARDFMYGLRWGGVALSCVSFLAALWCFWLGRGRRRAQLRNHEIAIADYYAQMYQPFLAPEALQQVGIRMSEFSAQLARGEAGSPVTPHYMVPKGEMTARMMSGSVKPISGASPKVLVVGVVSSGSSSSSGSNNHTSMSAAEEKQSLVAMTATTSNASRAPSNSIN